MDKSIRYRKGVVIFIDMLGTQSKADIESIYSDFSIFHDTILNKDGKTITDGRNGGIASGNVIWMHAHSFSDCAYLLYMYDDDYLNSDIDKARLIENALCHFERIALKLLDYAILFRGGVSYGEVFYEKEKNILFGPAINKAFQLENTDAKNPRILVSDEVERLYNNYFQQCVEYFEKPRDKYCKLIQRVCKLEGFENPKECQGRMIIKDSMDDRYIVNYLNSINTVSNIFLPEIITESMDFKKAVLLFAQEKKRQAEQKENISVQEKYSWLIDYIQS